MGWARVRAYWVRWSKQRADDPRFWRGLRIAERMAK